MDRLSDLSLKTSYHKGQDNVAEDFYLPCMRRAVEFDRAVGYFRSTVFVIAWPALREFVGRGGRIRVLCSHVLSDEDIEALAQGYAAKADAKLAAQLIEEVRALLADQEVRDCARILAALVARGTLEFKIATFGEGDNRSARGRIFHDKLGIFRDASGNVVIFKGSMNETWSGLAADGNLESVDVAASWMGSRDLERAKTEETYFNDLWGNQYPNLRVRPFPAVAREEFERIADPEWQISINRLLEKHRARSDGDVRGRTLRPHQSAGLAAWKSNGRRGILAFATGSGKTFTAITAIREALQEYKEVVFVIVPDEVLFLQWHAELSQTTKDLGAQILRVGAGYSDWRGKLRLWMAPSDYRRIILATIQSASSDDFLERLSGEGRFFLVADEVHRLGSPRHRTLLKEGVFGPRLGLSATPERAGDEVGTQAITTFFHGILQPRYTLSDAVRDKVLTPYFYRPHTVRLADDEVTEWGRVSLEIKRLLGRLAGGDQTAGLHERAQQLFIKRARIVKQARGKIPLAVDVLTSEYRPDQRWIVYCEDSVQLNAVSRSLAEAGIDNMPFHSAMEGDRTETLRWLERRGGVVVAIRCLDEGVDVPSVSHALILASSKNPREFVQRRGRVLRWAPHKSLAYVHDAIVLPPMNRYQEGPDLGPDPITAGELARAVEFAQSADNPAAGADLQQIAIEAGIDWTRLVNKGVEDADD